jgi:mono/diheme cytochrome c family protein
VDDSLSAGKTIRCPKCGNGFAVPATNGTPPAPPKKVAPPPAPEEETGEEPEEAPERPARRKFRKKRKQSSGSGTLVLGLAVGLLFVAGGALAFVIIHKRSDKKAEPVAANNPAPPVPPSFAPAEGGPRQAMETGMGLGPGFGAGARPGDAMPPGMAAMPTMPTVNVPPQFVAGRRVFEAHNCTRCHVTENVQGASGSGPPMRRGKGPNLAAVGKDPAHTVAWLMEHVRDPRAHRPESRMPAYGDKMSESDLKSLAQYLASLK